MIKVGITGGIGSGKSVVSDLLRTMRIPVYDADNESKRLLVEDKELKKSLINLLGEKIYDGDVLNKVEMANAIFNDKTLLRKSNEIIHPAVRYDFLKWCEKNKQYEIVFIESALIFEANFNNVCDRVLMVFAPEDLRIKRTIKRDNSTIEKVKSRIKNQMSDLEKCKLSDFIIYNDDSSSVILQLNDFLESIKK